MKKLWIGVLVVVLVLFGVWQSNWLEAQSNYFWSLFVRTNLELASGSTFTDASTATHTGANTFSGAVTLSSTLDVGSAIAGLDTFTTTATADTVLLSGCSSSDFIVVTGVGGSVDQQDVLQVEAKTDTFIVHRLASGASALSYKWIRLK